MLGLITAVALALPAQAEIRDWPSAGGFDITQTEESCGMFASYPIAGRSPIEFALIESGDRVTLALASGDWSSQDGREYSDLRYLVGSKAFSGSSWGFVSGFSKGFTVIFGPEILADFAGADRLFVARGEAVVANLSLRGTGAAIAVLRRCTSYRAEQAAAQARREASVDYLAKDPFAENAETGDAPLAPGSVPPPVLTNPTWSARPSGEFPERAASRGIETGSADLECRVEGNGSVRSCTILNEFPAGAGFGQAALAGSRRARLTPRSVDSVAAGGIVRFTTRFSKE